MSDPPGLTPQRVLFLGAPFGGAGEAPALPHPRRWCGRSSRPARWRPCRRPGRGRRWRRARPLPAAGAVARKMRVLTIRPLSSRTLAESSTSAVGRRAERELEAAHVDQELEVARHAFQRAADGGERAGVLEGADDLHLQQLRQRVAPLRIGQRRADACRRDGSGSSRVSSALSAVGSGITSCASGAFSARRGCARQRRGRRWPAAPWRPRRPSCARGPATMPSRRSELRASAPEKVSRLAIMLRSGCGVLGEDRVEAAQRRRARPATCSGRRRDRRRGWAVSPLAAASGDVEVPPVSAITGDPVRPWKSMPTAVSARTGVLRSMAMVACTWRGLSGLSCEARHLADADAVEQHGRSRAAAPTPSSRSGCDRRRARAGRRRC